ncbi:DUF6387 family protein [Lamprobacter modestohalophilus]|uniref:DUF6387 family protein n=1 Tax=Lamprobacter modestohalophilus TaxID=1064514 RepID=UPI002ADEC1C1|nr:DUF6387 family protein [Lamprobacter modestohalophilus]MEA1050498.1 DUF6387 family protein [Lamprobacter modestohalophilus]
MIKADIATTDKALVEAFKQWLRKEREHTGVDQPYLRGKDQLKRSERTARLIGKQQLSKWARWRILGYWDINLWLEIQKKEKPTPDQWLKILFPDEATHPAPRFDELKAEAEWLLSEKALNQISAAAALDSEQ